MTEQDTIVFMKESNVIQNVSLSQRLGSETFKNRLEAQKEHSSEIYSGFGMTRFHPENMELLAAALKVLLGWTHLERRATKNSQAFTITHRDFSFTTLPKPFEGFTILHLSDLHIEGFADGGEKLCGILESLPCDICVITGDFRFETSGPFDRCIALTRRLVGSIRCRHGIYGILGNHDFVEMTGGLEETGITMLLNEHIRITKKSSAIVLAGIDDPHFYRTGNIAGALDGVGQNDFIILLSHSPESYRHASEKGVRLFLCGHTHSGQICLPGGIPIIVNAKAPRVFSRGSWNYLGMYGYTSRGIGSAGLPARFNCTPEIIIHRLLCAP